MMTEIVLFRNPDGPEENWMHALGWQRRPNLFVLTGAGAGFAAAAAVAAIESVVYAIFAAAALFLKPRACSFYVSLIKSSLFTIVWAAADLFFHNFFHPNLVSRESSARVEAARICPCFAQREVRAQARRVWGLQVEVDNPFEENFDNRGAPRPALGRGGFQSPRSVSVPKMDHPLAAHYERQRLPEDVAFLAILLNSFSPQVVASLEAGDSEAMMFFAFHCVYAHVFGVRRECPILPQIQGDARRGIEELRRDVSLRQDYDEIQVWPNLKSYFENIIKIHPEAFDQLDFETVPEYEDMSPDMRGYFEEINALDQEEKDLLQRVISKLKRPAASVLQGGQFLSTERLKSARPHVMALG